MNRNQKTNGGRPTRPSTTQETTQLALRMQRMSEFARAESARFPQPKILLIDMPDEVAVGLRTAGYNISLGSFGTPYQMPTSAELQPIVRTGEFVNNFAEQDIVVVDLYAQEVLNSPETQQLPAPNVGYWWAGSERGFIDPRPLIMVEKRDAFDRIVEHGGIFLIFAAAPVPTLFKFGSLDQRNKFREAESLEVDTWQFLSALNAAALEVRPHRGNEMKPSTYNFADESLAALQHLIARHLASAHYTCTLHPLYLNAGRWMSLATNKFADPVAGIIIVSGESPGIILLLPQIVDKQQFLQEVLHEVLPGLAPHLFPHARKLAWIHQPAYELPAVLQAQQRIQAIEAQAQREIAVLEQEMEDARQAHGYLHALLTATGDALVQAVKTTLELFEFTQVIDVDAEMQARGDTGQRREDLRIEEGPGLKLVEIKGLTGLPKEAAALQVAKYMIARMRTLNRTDIHGLSIVNHERNLPPLARQNTQPFSEDVVTNAEEQGFGLLTTWDLFRLARSYLSCQWPPEVVKPLFQRSGRIEPIPAHYQLVGTIANFYDKAKAVEIQLIGEIACGDRISFEQPVEFLEHEISSLQVNRQPIPSVQSGPAGVQVPFKKEQMRPGTRVFRIIP